MSAIQAEFGLKVDTGVPYILTKCLEAAFLDSNTLLDFRFATSWILSLGAKDLLRLIS